MNNKTNHQKSFWERINDDFNRNYFLCLIAWAFVCLLFSKPINLAVLKISGLLFSTDEDSIAVYQLVILGFLLLIYFFRFLLRNRIIKIAPRILYVITPIVIWLALNMLVNLNPVVSFTIPSHFPRIPLVSVFFIAWGVELMILIYSYKWKEPYHRENKSSFITDIAFNPNKKEHKDILGFDSFAQRIATEAKNISSSESVVFGINGEWGEGKTSMINLIRQKLETDGYTVVDFHPWKTNSGKAVTQLFFDVLKDGLKGKIVGINWKIDRYAEALLHLDKTGFGKMLWQLFASSDSVEGQKKKLGESMKMLTQNLIVIVDDLDRLAKNEIADVLKLMRDTANFPNLVFIAAYDRKYLNEAIKEEINNYKAEDYMDKIVLWEAPIYRPQASKYLDYLKEQMTNKLSEFSIEIDEILKKRQLTSKTLVYKYLLDKNGKEMAQTNDNLYSSVFVNLRTVKRFVNDFVFNFKIVKEQVDFEDFFHLSLIRHFYPKHYTEFKRVFFHISKNSNNERLGKIDSTKEKYWNGIISKEELKEDTNTPIVLEIIYNLIKEKIDVKNSKSFSLYMNFPIYFYLGNYQDVTMSDLSISLYANDIESFKNKLSPILETGTLNHFHSNNIVDALRSNFYLIKNEDLLVYSQELIWLSIKIDNQSFYLKTHLELQELMVVERIEKGNLKKVLYEFIKKESIERKAQNLIQQVIYDFKTAYAFEEVAHTEKPFYIGIDNSIEISVENFNNHINEISGITIQTISLFYCSYQRLNRDMKFENNTKVIESMQKLVYQYPDDFLQFLVVNDRINSESPTNKTTYSNRFSDFLLLVFKDYEELRKYLRVAEFKKQINKTRAELYLEYSIQAFKEENINTQESFIPKNEDKDTLSVSFFLYELCLGGKYFYKTF